MTRNDQTKRVFVLGAGFSKPADMPDARELTNLLLRLGHRRNNPDFIAWIGDLQQRIANLEGNGNPSERLLPNIEQLFDYAQFDRELWMMKQQTLPVDRAAGETFHAKAESIATWLFFMEDDLAGVLLDCQNRARPEMLDPFVRQLRTGDTVLTFNYDTLLENRIEEAGKTWSHGFEGEPSADVFVLKLHGSLDWWMFDRDRLNTVQLNKNEFEKFTLLFKKEDRNMDWKSASQQEKESADYEYRFVLLRAHDLHVAKTCDDMYTGLCQGEPPRPGLGGLGAHKPLHRLVGSSVVWQRAFSALRKADDICVVGWSCSPYDTMARFHFASVMRLREEAPTRTVIVDPNADDIRNNFAPVFGKLELVNKQSEHVDWSKLLDSSTARAEARGSVTDKETSESMNRVADRAQNAAGWVLVPFLFIASFGGIVGGIAMIVSLFAQHGVGWGIAGIVFVPVAALLFPVYFGLWNGVWWPLAWYAACGIAAAAAWWAARLRRSDESSLE